MSCRPDPIEFIGRANPVPDPGRLPGPNSPQAKRLLAQIIGSTEEDVEPATEMQSQTIKESSSRPRPVLVFLAAALSVAIIGGLPLLLFRGSSPQAPGPDLTPGAVTTARNGGAIAPGSPVRRGLSVPDGLSVSSELVDTAVGTPWIVVVGYVTDGHTTAPAVWHSTDAEGALAYSSLPTGEFAADTVEVTSVSASEDGFLAVGQAQTEAGTPPQAVVWLSADGRDWKLYRPLGLLGSVSGVGHAGGRWLAVGRSADTAAIWHSTDGVEWQASLLEPPREDDSGSFVSALSANAELVVAVGGTSGDPGASERPRIWMSADGGLNWSITSSGELFDVAVGDGLNVVAVGARGVIVSGQRMQSEGERPVGFLTVSSRDGRTWVEQAPLPGEWIAQAVVVDGGLVALGRDRTATSTNLEVHMSQDGGDWQTESDLTIEGFGISSAAAGEGAIVLIGVDTENPESNSWAVYSLTIEPGT